MVKRHKPVQITLAHINDTHSYFEPHSLQLELDIEEQRISPYVSNGGFARIATRAKLLKQQAVEKGREFLFLHGGDCFQGTLYFSLFKGEANADLLNALDIDAMVLGNHELDMGNQPVAEFLKRISFPLLAGNWDVSKESDNKGYRVKGEKQLYAYDSDAESATWITKTIQGESVALFGVSIDQMDEIANPDSDTSFIDTFETVKRTVSAIHNQGINKIILLSHLGYAQDKELASRVDGIGLIIGGHSHTLQGDFSALGLEDNGPYGISVNGTRIVQAGLYAQALGHCEIDFDIDGRVTFFRGKNELLLGRRLCIDASLSTANTDYLHRQALECLRNHPNIHICKKDQQVHSLLQDKYIPKVRELQQTIIGNISTPLRHVRIPDEKGGSEIVPLVAESFYHMMKDNYPVEFAIHNAGGIRTSLNPGPVSVADIAGKLLPFAVPIGIYYIKGRNIALALEGAINNALNNGVIGTGTGSYPYCYRLDYEYHFQAAAGERIKQLRIFTDEYGWQAVQDQKIYCGTSSAYTMKGKEGYLALTKTELPEPIISQHSMADCFVEYLRGKIDS